MLAYAVEQSQGPTALCYPRGGEGRYTAGWDGSDSLCLREGADVTIAVCGTMVNEALEAADMLLERGIQAEVVKLSRIAPLAPETVLRSVEKTGALVTAEECFHTGSVGQRLCEAVLEQGIRLRGLRLLSCGDRFVYQGSVTQLRRSLGIDAAGIAEAVCEVCHGKDAT